MILNQVNDLLREKAAEIRLELGQKFGFVSLFPQETTNSKVRLFTAVAQEGTIIGENIPADTVRKAAQLIDSGKTASAYFALNKDY